MPRHNFSATQRRVAGAVMLARRKWAVTLWCGHVLELSAAPPRERLISCSRCWREYVVTETVARKADASDNKDLG